MTLSVLVLLLAVPTSGMNLGRGKGFLAQDLNQCTKEGQEELVKRFFALQQKSRSSPSPSGGPVEQGPTGAFPADKLADLANPPHWPADPIEDPGTLTYAQVGLAKSFVPPFSTNQFANEIRDTLTCTFKRMTCMSLDDMGAPMDTMLGINAFYAIYDALPVESRQQYDDMALKLRRFVFDPLFNTIYFTFVKPNKDEVESHYKWFPQRVVPSMPSEKAGDWDIQQDYSTAGQAYLPVPSGQEDIVYRDASGQPSYSLLQMETEADHQQFASTEASLMDNAQKSRRECDERSTEMKKLRCHMDFGKVMLQLAKQMRKFGRVPNLSPAQVERHMQSLLEVEEKKTTMQNEEVAKCEAQKQAEES